MPPQTAAANYHRKLPSLDGWRAVSICLVLIAHCTYAKNCPKKLNQILIYVDFGGSGVMFFFVISGFLITWLLLREQQVSEQINLSRFYLRRALRILPVYFAYLLVLASLTDYRQDRSFWLANLTFTTNFHIPPFATAHLWSLAVEEQFYLLWPCILAFKVNKNPKRLLAYLAVPLIVAPIMRLMECKHWYGESQQFLFQWGSFFTRFDCLAYGCIGAVLLAYNREKTVIFFQKKVGLKIFVVMSLIAFPTFFRVLHFPASIQAACGNSFLALGFIALLLHSVLNPGLVIYRWLNWNWVAHLGVLSYSIYIWQQMFCGTSLTVFGMTDAWWTRFPVWILCALVAAHASFYLLERPLLRLRAKFR